MRSIPDPGFSGDTGAATDAVTTALAAYVEDPDRLYPQTLAVLQSARLLVPVIAVLGDVEYDEHGRPHDKSSDMATVLMRGADGRMALLAFTGSDSLTAWNAEARPVPVPTAKAAEAALQDEAVAMVVDVAGPVMFVIEQEDLRALRDGYTMVDLHGRHAWVMPE